MPSDWNREELLAAFNFYCRTPFGKFHARNPDVIDLAKCLDRTPAALVFKLGNFASLDPAYRARGGKGLVHVGKGDRALWDEFHSDPSRVAVASQIVFESLTSIVKAPGVEEVAASYGSEGQPTETVREQRVRLVQSFFRQAVLATYESKCAFCKIDETELLSASHIIPWNKDEQRRADPRNGLSLCALHDRAFDRGFLSVDASLKILVSKALKRKLPSMVHQAALLDIEGEPILKARRFIPDPEALTYHRDKIFRPDASVRYRSEVEDLISI